MDMLERYVAIDDKYAWPNLTLMPTAASSPLVDGSFA